MPLNPWLGQITPDIDLSDSLEGVTLQDLQSLSLTMLDVRVFADTRAQSHRSLVECTVEEGWKPFASTTCMVPQGFGGIGE